MNVILQFEYRDYTVPLHSECIVINRTTLITINRSQFLMKYHHWKSEEKNSLKYFSLISV